MQPSTSGAAAKRTEEKQRAQASETELIPILDSEGVRGTVSSQAWQRGDEQMLIEFDQGRRVQVPRSVLRPRAEGGYDLPFSLRALADTTQRLERTPDDSDDSIVAVIPVVAEEAQVAKREIETGRVRIRKTVETSEEEVDVPLLHEQVRVERVPVERYLDEAATPHYQGDTLIIPVMEEVLVVEKRLWLREEIHVTTVRTEVPHQETVTLRREQLTITREAPDRDEPAA